MSKIDLALLCAYGFRKGVEVTERPSGIEARIGMAAHGLVEDWYHEAPPRALEPDVADKATRIAKQLIAWLEPRRDRIIFCETGLRYDAENDRAAEGPKRGEPGYADVPPMVIPGTLDLALRGEDGVLEVIDVKTGQKRYVHNEQVDTQALALARKLRETTARVGFIYPRLTKCDDPELRTLDENDLDVHAGILHGLMRHLQVAKPEAGEWCWRCDARPGCPAYRESRDESSERELEGAGFFT
jgi:hypothetical protein